RTTVEEAAAFVLVTQFAGHYLTIPKEASTLRVCRASFFVTPFQAARPLGRSLAARLPPSASTTGVMIRLVAA
ncbi:hypothetical protein AB4Z21_27830, partial [Paenibacillus sp. MCAF20]